MLYHPLVCIFALITQGDPLDNTLSALQPQPQEIFRGGMAYYNAQPPVRTLPKRPRAAIPIVPPPEMEVNLICCSNLHLIFTHPLQI